MEPTRMAFLGGGRVGQTLSVGLAGHGHEVMLGSRDPEGGRVAGWRKVMGARGRVGTYEEAAGWAEWVFVCVPGRVAETAVSLATSEAISDKVVVDVTNTMVRGEHGLWALEYGLESSAGEKLQQAAPVARVVKAFNTVGYRKMIDPEFAQGPPTMPICGEDDEAKTGVARMLRDIGWEAADVGGIAQARILEAMTLVWLAFGQVHETWMHAFKILHE